jgi:hypothetical protein
VETGIARKSVEGNFPLSLLSEGILVGSVFDWSQKEEDVKVFLVFLLVFALFFRVLGHTPNDQIPPSTSPQFYQSATYN